MKDKYEVLVTGDTGGGLGVWDPSTGNCLQRTKGRYPHSLSPVLHQEAIPTTLLSCES